MSESEDSSGNSTTSVSRDDVTQTADSSQSTTSTTRLSLVAERLRQLKEKRESARKENIAEVAKEDYENRLPLNHLSKERRIEWEKRDFQARKEAQESGLDYDREKLLSERADEVEKWEAKRKRKKNPDQGFADFQQASYRQYQRLTKQLKPDMEAYESSKSSLPESALYPSVDTLPTSSDQYPTHSAVQRLVDDVEKQISKRKQFSRRREFKFGKDIDYINERNKKFNEKAERFYGKYTAELKQNLERGTAI
ncbi:Pre-mRNA-splicing factor SYF2 isoform X2 [Oopsacas minuta]|uniref:Pre-mRNA-splicing factor SYF2 n=1 Tax=Oopsacas minuta TaxID=111878 RepID=A0AAV7JP19_9METZ|nr:Pre-mRNA-splicing factor SYF2 isoform X2 [Oopsacas minuta]